MATNQYESENECSNYDEPQQQYIEIANRHIEKIGGLHRGFNLEKWLAAETKIDQLLTEK